MFTDALKIAPKNHQIEGFEFALKHRYTINAYKMGHGKTLIGIMLSIHTGKSVVVVPAYLKKKWGREYIKFSSKELKIKVLNSKDVGFVPTDEDVIILNYAILKNFKSVFDWATTLIVDEAHYLGNPEAIRTDKMDDYIQDCGLDYVLFLTGSPVLGKAMQWYAPLFMMSRCPFETNGKKILLSYNKFKEKFCFKELVRIAGGRMIAKFYGIRNTELLHTYMLGKYKRKSDKYEVVLPEFFEKEVMINYDKVDKELQKAFEEYEKTKEESDAISSAKMHSAVSKIPFTAKYSEDIHNETGEPIVIFSDHVLPVEEIAAILTKKKYKVAAITGETEVNKRDDYVSKFQNGNLDFIVATIGSASTGFDMFKASNMVFNDKSWIHEYNEQAMKRIHRMGQTKNCIFHNIYATKFDRFIDKVCVAKSTVSEATTEWEAWQDL